LREFQGRCPTIQEVSEISDRHWLATPDIGPSTLEKIHDILRPQTYQRDSTSPQMTDDELLARLEFIQEELRRIQHVLAEVQYAHTRDEGTAEKEPAG
jgi:hypothetical protein